MEKGSGLSGGKLHPNSISSQFPPEYKFWFVTVAPKYLNYVTFSKDLLLSVSRDSSLNSGDETATCT
jgi:hypothetical protein